MGEWGKRLGKKGRGRRGERVEKKENGRWEEKKR